jgi:hypothetical protein
MSEFVLGSDAISLPKGAWAKTHRNRLRYNNQDILALTQGNYRSYVFPLMSPAGFCVTAEGPADHPHHSGMWIASDHVHALMPAADGLIEEYTYNFYVNETFQGRAPGRIVEVAAEGRDLGDSRFQILQLLEWRGPRDWAAETGRLVARETRTITVEAGERRHRIDVVSQLAAADFAVKLGATRHAYFNVRVADAMVVANGGVIRDDRGRIGGPQVSGGGGRWVDFSGPVGGGATAGVSVIPQPISGREQHWFVADWGVVTVGPFREIGLKLESGQSFESCHTLLVHDGAPDIDEIESVAVG